VIKQGDLVHLWREASSKKSFLSNRRNRNVHLILLTDLLLVTKYKRKIDQYIVLDYCYRAYVDVAPLELSAVQVRPVHTLQQTSR